MAPLLIALRQDPRFEPYAVVTGQHREMLDQVHGFFDIDPDEDLDIFTPGQSLTDITTRTLQGLEPVLVRLRPDAVLVQGDTTTTFASALAAFYHSIPVVHLEAGLRTADRYSPYPEEINRRLTTQLSSLHLAPTATSARNLLAEGVDPETVVITGNSVIDAMHLALARGVTPAGTALQALESDPDRRMVLVTVHRRESWGEPLKNVARALHRIAERFDDVTLLVPLHRNPVVREAVVPILKGLRNVEVVDPLPYDQFCWAQQRSCLVITDSGGVQEEAPSLGKPVLVLRDNTERPEAVEAGTVRLCGTDTENVVEQASRLLEDDAAYTAMARAVNPYGDGRTAERAVAALAHFFSLGPRAVPFEG